MAILERAPGLLRRRIEKGREAAVDAGASVVWTIVYLATILPKEEYGELRMRLKERRAKRLRQNK